MGLDELVERSLASQIAAWEKETPEWFKARIRAEERARVIAEVVEALEDGDSVTGPRGVFVHRDKAIAAVNRLGEGGK